MLEALTIIIIAAIVLGAVTSMASMNDKFTTVSGLMFTVFGFTALFWTAKAVGPYLRVSEGIGWFYRPLANLPEWIGYAGVATTALLWTVAVAFLVDDFVHLPRQKGGRR